MLKCSNSHRVVSEALFEAKQPTAQTILLPDKYFSSSVSECSWDRTELGELIGIGCMRHRLGLNPHKPHHWSLSANIWWRGGLVVSALDQRSRGRVFESRWPRAVA